MAHVPHVTPSAAGQDVRLLEAARRGDLSAVKQLIGDGADPNQTDANGETPLLFAAMSGHLAVAKLLLAAGADASRRDSLGYDAYSAAQFFGDLRGTTRPPFDEIMRAIQGEP